MPNIKVENRKSERAGSNMDPALFAGLSTHLYKLRSGQGRKRGPRDAAAKHLGGKEGDIGDLKF